MTAVLSRFGAADLAILCGLQIIAVVLCGAAWRVLAPESTLVACAASRAIRDGVSSILAIVPGSGEVAGVRALALFGTRGGAAAASGVVDLATEILSQCLFTLLGAAALLWILGAAGGPEGGALVVGATLPALLLAWLLGTGRGRALTARLIVRGAAFAGPRLGEAGADLATRIAARAAESGRVAGATAIHLVAWLVGAAQVWAASHGFQHPLTPVEALALTAIVHAARGALFVVPWGAGVQEAGFVVAGRLVGMDEPTALALSLAMRGRDVILGVPALVLWAAAEGIAAWKARVRGGS